MKPSPSTPRAKPSFIVLCGCEGSGKSTIVEALKDKTGFIVTREPGGSAYAEDIRELMFKNPGGAKANAETMFGLFWAARADHLLHKVIPALKAGTSVVSDRFDCCTFAYQVYGQEARQLEKLFWTMRAHYLRDCKPDFYIFLDVNVEEGLRRVAGRPGNKTHFDERDTAFHERIRQGYLDFIEKAKQVGSNAIIVDANKPLAEVRGEVLDIINKLVFQ